MENDFVVYANSVVMEFESKAKVVCNNFHPNKRNKYKVFIYDPKNNIWIKANINNDCTAIMHECFLKHRNMNSKVKIQSLMAHPRAKKKGSGGIRLSKWNGTITDYECAKVPLHDFPRSYCINWN